MANEFSLAHLTVLPCSPPEMVNIAAKAGYNYVSFRITSVTAEEESYPLMNDRTMMRETKQRLADTGLKVLDVELARLDPATEPETYQLLFEVCGELAARAVIAQLPDSDRARAVDRFGRLCDLAAPYGLTVDLEFPSWTETPDLPAAVSVLETVRRPNAGILVDTLHFDRSRSSLEELEQLPREWFHFVHLCDAPKEIPATTDGVIRTARSERLPIGEGELDLRAILQRIPPVPYSLEIPNDALKRKMGTEAYAEYLLRCAEQFFAG
jgi:sugar phosphate isomerase/epimerase